VSISKNLELDYLRITTSDDYSQVLDPCRKAKYINRNAAASRKRKLPHTARLSKIMAKTYKNLYPKIYDFRNLHAAYLKARRGKRYKDDVLSFSAHLEESLIQLQNELIWHTYQTGAYKSFCVYEPKKRLIMALPFRDRVAHHAICNIIEPIWEKRFISDSYACRVEKGTHAGVDRLTRSLRWCRRTWGRTYCFKADVLKYFASIDHNALKKLLRKRIACPDTLGLCDAIIDSVGDDTGIPIGNLTSQLFANIYLHELDEFVKYTLRERFYVRYMDDFIVLSSDKNHLHAIRKKVEEFLWDKLRLRLNRKTQIFPVKSRGVDFLGYRTWPTHRLIRKSSIKRMKRKLKFINQDYRMGKISLKQIKTSIMSWVAHCKHADTYRLRQKIVGEILL